MNDQRAVTPNKDSMNQSIEIGPYSKPNIGEGNEENKMIDSMEYILN